MGCSTLTAQCYLHFPATPVPQFPHWALTRFLCARHGLSFCCLSCKTLLFKKQHQIKLIPPAHVAGGFQPCLPSHTSCQQLPQSLPRLIDSLKNNLPKPLPHVPPCLCARSVGGAWPHSQPLTWSGDECLFLQSSWGDAQLKYNKIIRKKSPQIIIFSGKQSSPLLQRKEWFFEG